MQIQGGTEVAYRTVLAYRQYAGLEEDSNFADSLFSLHCDLIELAKEPQYSHRIVKRRIRLEVAA